MDNVYDVIVIGGGGAGVMAAAAAAEAGARTAILCKEPVGYGNTRMSVGMAACADIDQDSRQHFIEDIMKSGEGLSNRQLVETLVDDSRKAMAFLEKFGHTFIRNKDGQLSGDVISRAGGHTHPRTLRSSGSGIGMGQALRSATEKYNIHRIEDTAALSILKEKDRVYGVRVLDLATSLEYELAASAVVLATGGGGWLFYPQTTNNRGSCGDGYVLAYHAGAKLMDMEQIQAIPFGITHPSAYRGLICGEPFVTGPAGRVLDGQGNVVLEEGMNRLGRAEVVRAMASPIQEGRTTRDGGLLLDMEPNLYHPKGSQHRDQIMATGITATVLTAYGKKAYNWEEPWSVLPTVHFFMGGVHVDNNTTSHIPNLFAAGEVMGGVNGGNRLGSVALTEILVFGLRAGQAAASYAKRNQVRQKTNLEKRQSPLIDSDGKNRPVLLCQRLQKLMWQHAGLMRSREGLFKALKAVKELKKEAQDLRISNEKVYNSALRDAIELHFMLEAAELVLNAALLREESRGAHIRSDFPEKGGANWEKNTLLWKDSNGKLAHLLREVPK
ncbi:MAG: FAD-binding protein [Tindallia sp. MSAO_Bac2]|nr:MAG: FAD-binding protein [Tindallia sp. MSAO_Bac2]